MPDPTHNLANKWVRNVGEPLGSFPEGSNVPNHFRGVGSPLVGGLVQGGLGAAAGYVAGSVADSVLGADPYDPERRKRKYALLAGALAASPNLGVYFMKARPANLAAGAAPTETGSVKKNSYYGEPPVVPLATAISEVSTDSALDPFAKAKITGMMLDSYERNRSPFATVGGLVSVAAQSAAGAYLLPRVVAGIFGGLSSSTRDTLRQVGLLAPILNAAAR